MFFHATYKTLYNNLAPITLSIFIIIPPSPFYHFYNPLLTTVLRDLSLDHHCHRGLHSAFLLAFRFTFQNVLKYSYLFPVFYQITMFVADVLYPLVLLSSRIFPCKITSRCPCNLFLLFYLFFSYLAL